MCHDRFLDLPSEGSVRSPEAAPEAVGSPIAPLRAVFDGEPPDAFQGDVE